MVEMILDHEHGLFFDAAEIMNDLSLGNLPTDILILIFGVFCLHCQGEYDEPWDAPPLRYRSPRQKKREEKSWYSVDRQALASLSLVSRRFREIAQRILHHEFVLGYDDSWCSDLYTWDGRLILFMRTLRQRRDMARLVKAVYIHPRLLWAINRDRPRDVLGEAAETLGIDLAELWKSRIPRPESDDWIGRPGNREEFLAPLVYGPSYIALDYRNVLTRRRERDWVAAELVALLIAQLPNLELLSLQRCSRWTSEGVSASALAALNISSLSIRRLDIGPRPGEMVRLSPGLQTLNLNATGFLGQCPPLPNVKVLRMTEYWADERHLENILHACTGGLETFAYESWRPAPAWTGAVLPPNTHFQPSDAVRLLSFHQSTLKSLHLDLSAQGRVIGKIEDGLHLKDFAVLEHLSIGSEMIYGFDGILEEGIHHSEALIRLLPASLESLSIQTKQMEETGRAMLEKGLVRLAEAKQCQPDQFPNLRWVQCGLGKETGWLSDMFKAVNVQFTSSDWSLSKAKPYLNGTIWTVDRVTGITYTDEFSDDEWVIPVMHEEVV